MPSPSPPPLLLFIFQVKATCTHFLSLSLSCRLCVLYACVLSIFVIVSVYTMKEREIRKHHHHHGCHRRRHKQSKSSSSSRAIKYKHKKVPKPKVYTKRSHTKAYTLLAMAMHWRAALCYAMLCCVVLRAIESRRSPCTHTHSVCVFVWCAVFFVIVLLLFIYIHKIYTYVLWWYVPSRFCVCAHEHRLLVLLWMLLLFLLLLCYALKFICWPGTFFVFFCCYFHTFRRWVTEWMCVSMIQCNIDNVYMMLSAWCVLVVTGFHHIWRICAIVAVANCWLTFMLCSHTYLFFTSHWCCSFSFAGQSNNHRNIHIPSMLHFAHIENT